MASSSEFAIQPDDVVEATRQLDELATRFENVMAQEAANLTVVASGNDEVSQRVATTMNEVHAQFATSSELGRTEIQEIAASLRANTTNIVAADSDFVV